MKSWVNEILLTVAITSAIVILYGLCSACWRRMRYFRLVRFRGLSEKCIEVRDPCSGHLVLDVAYCRSIGIASSVVWWLDEDEHVLVANFNRRCWVVDIAPKHRTVEYLNRRFPKFEVRVEEGLPDIQFETSQLLDKNKTK